jgi:Fe-S oxidoreductase/nitrate reductase gamma subunit
VSEKTREVFWHFQPWLKVLWYFLAVASVAVFAYGVARPVLRYRRGRGGPWPPYPWRALPGRFATGARAVLAHRTIGRRDRVAGWAHRGIFYGFVVLFAGTVVLGFDTDFTDPVFGWNYFHGDFYLVYKEVLNLLGTALVVGLIAMMVRRAVVRPTKLSYEPGDWVFVVTLLVIALTGFVLEGVRIAMDSPGYGATQFVGWVIAQPLRGLDYGTLAGLRHGLWWFHGLLAITFVASIPYTKAAHMLTSFVSLSLRDPLAGQRLPPIPPECAADPAGYAAPVDFSPLHLLQLDACTKCGRCHEACPANASGLPLSPRDVVLELHQHTAARGGFEVTLIGDDAVGTDTLWSCMQCNACVEICPVGIEQAPIINQLRRRLVEEGEIDPSLQSTLQTIHRSGNSFGENRRGRGRWTRELEFGVKDARSEPVDVLWFVGDYASFDPRSQQVTRTLARLFERADLDFGILYDGERNSGNDVRRVGEEGLFESLAEHNIASISACEFNRIVTSDPHSLNTLRNEYPMMGGSWTVVHHTTLLLELIESGRLNVPPLLSYRVTYHDPCHLGRFNGEYDAPRRILGRLGCTLVEMPRNRDNSFCCGAGGGRIWIGEQGEGRRPSEQRIDEAVALDEVDLFVVACPKDVTMYEDAIKTSGHEGRITLREVTELVDEALSEEASAAARSVIRNARSNS